MADLLPGRKPLSEDSRREWRRLDVRSRLAAARRHRGLRQEDVAPAVGLSLSTYRRLENLQLDNPPLRYLVNCAIVLDVPLTSLLEDEWCEWMQFAEHAPAEPPEVSFWPRHDRPALPPG
jgi:transcriptional regulator with XRE-family HTH domain